MLSTAPVVTEQDLHELAALVRRLSGITLPPHRHNLIQARLGRRLRELNLGSFREYLHLLRDNADDEETAIMLDAITTNRTEFFREPDHFTHLGEVIRDASKGGQVRLLSAGCSSGEEPFSMSIIARETLGDIGPDRVTIEALDLSRVKLAQAKRGVFLDSVQAQLGRTRLTGHFLKGQGSSSGLVKLHPQALRLTTFRHHNLMRPLPFQQRFHAIFCCNVAIYFDRQIQEGLFARLFDHLLPGGFLYLGLAESLLHVAHRYDYVSPALYHRPAHKPT